MNQRLKFKILVCLGIYILLAVVFHQSIYYDQLTNWHTHQRVMHSLICEGQAQWLKDVARMSLSQADIDPMTNVSLAYMSPQGEISTCVAGWAGEIGDTPKVDADTIYQFASVTKVFTADTILQLVRDGRLNLNDKLVNLLPELYTKKLKDSRVANIEVSHLLEHRAGFDRMQLGIGDEMFLSQPWCPDHIEKLADITLQFMPGEKRAYSNLGYCLLSKIIEQKYQKPYSEVIRQRYHLISDKLNFVTDDIHNPTVNTAIKDIDTASNNYHALASSAGMYGTPSALVNAVYQMDKTHFPNITNRDTNLACDISAINDCQGYMGYEFSLDKNLSFYWRDGSMPQVSTVLIIDNHGGILAIMTNVTKDVANIENLVDDIYYWRYKNNLY